MRKKIELTAIGDIMFYVDENNDGDIRRFFRDDFSKLQKKLHKIANKIATKDEYGSENYNNQIKNVTAIKFKGRWFGNARIYCKDYYLNSQRVIVLSELLHSKKQNKLRQREKTLINRVNSYDYS